jgi:CspA family cold shock protein
VRFVIAEGEQTSGARLWRGTRKRVAASFFRLDEETTMPTYKGSVKWFNPTKGYGFIKPAGGDKDVFVHISAVERAGLSTLNENQSVEYDLVESRGKASAENLKVS